MPEEKKENIKTNKVRLFIERAKNIKVFFWAFVVIFILILSFNNQENITIIELLIIAILGAFFLTSFQSNKAIFLVFVISLLLVSAIGPLTAFGTDSTRFSAIDVVIYVLGATVITLFYRMIISMFFIDRKSCLTIFMWVVAVLFFIFLLR
jgi:hypothetical protein